MPTGPRERGEHARTAQPHPQKRRDEKAQGRPSVPPTKPSPALVRRLSHPREHSGAAALCTASGPGA